MVGGDIGGIAALASQLQGLPRHMHDVTDALDTRVANLVHDAGWWGDAADAFKGRWSFESRGARALAEVVGEVASILDALASTLRRIEGDLEYAASQARTAGVPVGSDGHPPQLVGSADPMAQAALAAYVQAWQAANEDAQRARMEADGRLQGVESVIAPPNDAGGHSLRRDQAASLGGVLADFWAVPAGSRSWLGDQRVPWLQSERDDAHAKFSAALKQYSKRHQPLPDDVKAARRETLERLQSAQASLDEAEGLARRIPFTKLLDTRTGDVLPWLKGVKFLGEIPVVDGIAVVVGTAASSYDDMQKGDDWTAVPKEAAVNVGAIAAATAVAVTIVGAAATSEVTAPAVVVVGGAVLAGGVVAVGVGELGYSLIHEHWDEDMHRDGVVGGLAHGVGDVAVNSGRGMVEVGHGAWTGAVGVWNHVFG
jgi:uncharacterized protein YukE